MKKAKKELEKTKKAANELNKLNKKKEGFRK